MGSNKRTDIQIQEDRLIIAEKYIKGWRRAQIVEFLKELRGYTLSEQMISYDLRVIKREWRERRDMALDEHVAHEIAEINQVAREAWDAWERSKKDENIITEKLCPDGDESAGITIKTVRTDPRIGDAKFLSIVKDCSVERRKILGLDRLERAAIKLNESLRDLAEDELDKKIAEKKKIIADMESAIKESVVIEATFVEEPETYGELSDGLGDDTTSNPA